jgi:general secretion pathway protein J
MKIRKKKTDGFTLLELALVVLFMGLFFSMLMAMKMQTDKIARMASSPSKKKREVYTIFNHILNTFNNAYFLKSHKNLIFIGQNEGGGESRTDRVTFATIDPYVNELNKESEAKEISFYLKRNEDGETYRFIKREDAIIDKYPQSGGVHIILLENVKSFELAYNKRATGDNWEEKWDSTLTKKMPKQIKIKLVTLTAGGKEIILEGMSRPGVLQKYK